jgi:hypothetical protein
MSDTPRTDIEFMKAQESLYETRVKLKEASEKLSSLKQSILDLSHPNLQLLLRDKEQLAKSRDAWREWANYMNRLDSEWSFVESARLKSIAENLDK